LFGMGKILFSDYLEASVYILVGAVSAGVIYVNLKKKGF